MSKKTMKVELLVNEANEFLRSANSVEERKGIISFLETVLAANGSYDGFRYLTSHQVPKGALPGIRPDGQKDVDEWFIDTDDTRREYFYK